MYRETTKPIHADPNIFSGFIKMRKIIKEWDQWNRKIEVMQADLNDYTLDILDKAAIRIHGGPIKGSAEEWDEEENDSVYMEV